MSLYGTRTGWEIQCTNCGLAGQTLAKTHKEAVSNFGTHGWIFYKWLAAWVHFCKQECKEEFITKKVGVR